MIGQNFMLKKLHSAKICQAETQIKQKETTTNTHTTAKKISTENFKSPTET